MGNAAKLVAASLLGNDGEVISIGGKTYTITPPTIKKIVGAGYYLADLGDFENVTDVMEKFKEFEKMAKALSWFIKGDESLSGELTNGTLTEVVNGIDAAVRLMDVGNFIRLSTLSKNVERLIAKQK